MALLGPPTPLLEDLDNWEPGGLGWDKIPSERSSRMRWLASHAGKLDPELKYVPRYGRCVNPIYHHQENSPKSQELSEGFVLHGGASGSSTSRSHLPNLQRRSLPGVGDDDGSGDGAPHGAQRRRHKQNRRRRSAVVTSLRELSSSLVSWLRQVWTGWYLLLSA